MKKILILTAFAVSAMILHADVLYWMVGDQYESDAIAQGENIAAYLYVIENGNTIKPAVDSVTGNDIAQFGAGGFEYNLGTYVGSGYSYFVELWNGMQSTPMDYTTAKNNGYIQGGGINVQMPAGSNGLGSGSQTYNVPEPTSGLLFIIGGMLLGLKRKRQV